MSEENKTHWKNNFDYNYLGSYSLKNGKDVVLTISKTQQEMVKGTNGQSEQCFVAYFVERADWIKPMILNKTNCKVISQLYTPYIEDWSGVKVQIGIAQVSAFGDTVDALRIRKKIPVTKKPELLPDTEDWANAVHHMLNEGVTLERVLVRYEISENNQNKLLEETKKDV